MDLQQLTYFTKAVELRSISDAAKALDVSQPAVTRGLANLERELGSKLLERSARGVSATAVGNKFYVHAKSVLRHVDRGVAEVQRSTQGGPLIMSIGTTPSFIDDLLPIVIDQLFQRFPDLELTVKRGLLPELRAALLHGEVDALFAINISPRGLGSFKLHTLMPAETVFVVGPKHPLAKLKRVTLERLGKERFAIIDSADVALFFDGLFEDRKSAPKPILRSDSMRLLKSLARVNEVVTFLPRFMVHGELRRGELVEVAFNSRNPSAKACLMHARGRESETEIAELIEISKAAAQKFQSGHRLSVVGGG